MSPPKVRGDQIVRALRPRAYTRTAVARIKSRLRSKAVSRPPSSSGRFAGPLPPDVQLYTVFAAAVSPTSTSDASRSLLKMLVSPDNASLLKKNKP